MTPLEDKPRSDAYTLGRALAAYGRAWEEFAVEIGKGMAADTPTQPPPTRWQRIRAWLETPVPAWMLGVLYVVGLVVGYAVRLFT